MVTWALLKYVFIYSTCWWLQYAKYYLIDFDYKLYELVQKLECQDSDTAPVEVLRVFKQGGWETRDLSLAVDAAYQS